MAYFQDKIKALPDVSELLDEEIFLDNLTMGEFFALPETEQARIWQVAHDTTERELDPLEQSVRVDAVPAR
jgi:hypothetical protein